MSFLNPVTNKSVKIGSKKHMEMYFKGEVDKEGNWLGETPEPVIIRKKENLKVEKPEEQKPTEEPEEQKAVSSWKQMFDAFLSEQEPEAKQEELEPGMTSEKEEAKPVKKQTKKKTKMFIGGQMVE